MAKNDNRAPEPTKAAPAAADLSAIEAKLGPLDEFRGRADSWMKEITAQVARLAGRSEDEERRKGALDKRLNDIEDRMQSLLTLTEMVSSSKNPFAGPPRGAQAATPDAGQGKTTDGTEGPDNVGVVQAPGPTQKPESLRQQTHPNDAMADPGAIEESREVSRTKVPESRPVADSFPPRAPASSGTNPSSQANQRFFVLEWARLLAPSIDHLDLSGFLGFYVEAGWVSPQIAATVRNLTLQLGRAAKGSESAMALDELHARSILLVGRLQGGAPRPETARATLLDAREVATGAWATVQR